MKLTTLPAVPPGACAPCRTGCPCAAGAPGCGHYGCRGDGPLTCQTALTSQAEYAERVAATNRQRAVYAARRDRWRSPQLLLP